MDVILGFAAALPDIVKAISEIISAVEQVALRLTLFGVTLYGLYRLILNR